MLKNISIRHANRLDVLDILSWRNDPKVIRGAIDKVPIEFKNHVNWFENQLKNKTLFLAHLDNRPLGVVSFTEEAKGSYSWSFYVVPEQQGKGNGVPLMELGLLIARNILGADRLQGEVQHPNRRSKDLHNRLGFIHILNDNNLAIYIKELK